MRDFPRAILFIFSFILAPSWGLGKTDLTSDYQNIVRKVLPEISNSLLVSSGNPGGALCSVKDSEDSQEEAKAEIGGEELFEKRGVILYRPPRVNAHQGGTRSQRALEEKAKEHKIEITKEEWLKLRNRFLMSVPELPGIREGVIQLPPNIEVESVQYVCKGEFCGWCYHPQADGKKYNYQADVEILPSDGLKGQRVRWRRQYTGREVEETYYINWKWTGPGLALPPSSIPTEEKVTVKNLEQDVWALTEKNLRQTLLEEIKNSGGEESTEPRRSCMVVGMDKKMGYEIEKLVLKCCKDFGGLKDLKISANKDFKEDEKVDFKAECRLPGDQVVFKDEGHGK